MLTLRSGESSLVVAPEIGGAIVGWTLGATPLMRRPLPNAIITSYVRGLACFPLVPFSNRIANGHFRWEGRDYTLARNFGDHPHTIHGVGWQRAWAVDAVDDASATLTLRHTPVGEQARAWPFAFSAELYYSLTQEALRVRLAMRNEHTSPAPAGLGLHPHFPRAGTPSLRFSARQVWLNGADALPSQVVAIPPEWDHAAAQPIGVAALDNCFTGWDGKAEITWADTGIGLAIEAAAAPFHHVVVYTPPGRDFFCVEPVSHMNDAINHMADVPDNGLRIVPSGDILTGEVTFRVSTSG